MPGIIRVALFIVALICILIFINTQVPSQHVPWQRLDPEAPIGFSTKAQMTRLALGPANRCMKLATNIDGLDSGPAEPKSSGAVCGWDVARLMNGTNTLTLRPDSVPMQCPLSVGSYIWLGELEALALKHFKSPLSKILHMGTYSCRRQKGNSSGAWSEHAFANAWDIAGFELADGRTIMIRTDWKKGTRAEKKFLRAARNKACKIFRVVLSPDYNAAHHDHFHLDMGPSGTCR